VLGQKLPSVVRSAPAVYGRAASDGSRPRGPLRSAQRAASAHSYARGGAALPSASLPVHDPWRDPATSPVDAILSSPSSEARAGDSWITAAPLFRASGEPHRAAARTPGSVEQTCKRTGRESVVQNCPARGSSPIRGSQPASRPRSAACLVSEPYDAGFSEHVRATRQMRPDRGVGGSAIRSGHLQL
jgi:hypothetical protein